MGLGATRDLTLAAMEPKASIMRLDDDASTTAFLPGRADLCASLGTVARQDPAQGIEPKFRLRNWLAHVAVRQRDFTTLRWPNTFVFLIRGSGGLQRLSAT